MLAWGAAELAGRGRGRWRKIVLAILASAILAGLGVRTRAQVRLWQNSFTLYEHTLAVTWSNYKIHHNYGSVLAQAGRIDDAVEQFRLALRIWPQFAQAHLNIGRAFLLQAKAPDAIKHCKAALQSEPDMVEAYEYMGRAYASQRRYDLAIESYNQALRIQPGYPNLHFNMATALAMQGRYDEAIEYFQKVALAKPDWPGSYYSLADIYYRRGQMRLAVGNYYKTLELERNQLNVRITALDRLVRILTDAKSGVYNPSRAIQLAKQACQLSDYKNPEMLSTLAAAYAAAGRFDLAVTTSESALQLAATAGNNNLAKQLRNRLRQYRQGGSVKKPDGS